MKKEITVTDGMITEEIHTVPGLTVSHERKMSDGNYGTTSYGAFYQLDLSIDATEQDKIAALNNGFQIVRAAVDSAFAGGSAAPTLNEARIIADLGGEVVKETPKKAPYKKYTPREQGPSDAPKGKAALFQELVDNPNKWFINDEKPSPSYPDFKRKGTGDGLWIGDAPAELAGRVQALLTAKAGR